MRLSEVQIFTLERRGGSLAPHLDGEDRRQRCLEPSETLLGLSSDFPYPNLDHDVRRHSSPHDGQLYCQTLYVASQLVIESACV